MLARILADINLAAMNLISVKPDARKIQTTYLFNGQMCFHRRVLWQDWLHVKETTNRL